MAVSPALRRLLRIRDLEEEQHRLILELASGELCRLENALAAATARRRRGRELAHSSEGSDPSIDRRAGIVETGAAHRHMTVLSPRIASAQEVAARLREEFLEKRVERRQSETLIEAKEAQDAIDVARRSQQTLDEWYRSRVYRSQSRLNAGAHDFTMETSANSPRDEKHLDSEETDQS